jgi:hypothetical protein
MQKRNEEKPAWLTPAEAVKVAIGACVFLAGLARNSAESDARRYEGAAKTLRLAEAPLSEAKLPHEEVVKVAIEACEVVAGVVRSEHINVARGSHAEYRKKQ